MAYITQADIEARYPGELAQAGPRDASGNLDPAAIALACAEASARADGYLRVSPAGFTVPLPPPAPDWLADMVVDIALYQATPTAIASQDDFKDRRKRYEDALAALEGIAGGKFLPQAPPVNPAGVAVLYMAYKPRWFGRGVL
ncbi:MAG: phage protein Gp36 family protein [Candidatus Competibacter sp.]